MDQMIVFQRFVVPAAATIIGCLVSILVARRYYIKAAKDLESETQKIRKLVKISLRALESTGFVEMVKDQDGEITGIVQNGEIHELVVSSVSALPDAVKIGVRKDVPTSEDGTGNKPKQSID